MSIDYDHNQVNVPQEIVTYCDGHTFNTNRKNLRYIDCIYMNMGYYGNDLNHLKMMRQRISPIFE